MFLSDLMQNLGLRYSCSMRHETRHDLVRGSPANASGGNCRISLDYAAEKFGTAIEIMATSSSTLQERLHSAYMSFHPIQDRNFPTQEMKHLYRQIMQKLTVIKDPDRGYVPATLAQMTDADAEDVAKEIHSLYLEIKWQREHGS